MSHSLGQVREMADRVLWMHYGEVRMFGPTEEVMNAYDKFIADYKALSGKEQAKYRSDYRAAQQNFTLDDLYDRSLKRERKNSGKDIVPAEVETSIYRATHNRHLSEHWSFVDKTILVLLLLITIFVADKVILNLGMRNIVENPTHLVTNWSPDKIHELNVEHMADDLSAK